MDLDYPGVYLPTDTAGVYESTPLADAGWYEQGQHGGALAALYAGHIEDLPTLAPMQVSRLTVEIFRVVRLVPLRLESEIVREGKRIQTIVVRAYDMSGTLLSMATAQRLRTADLELPEHGQNPALQMPPPSASGGPPRGVWGPGRADKVMFHRHAMEVHEVDGGFSSPGPGSVWMRLRKQLIAGRENSPLQRAVATADFVNGVSAALDLEDWIFMNPDLTIHLTRYPTSDWIGLSARSAYQSVGRGLATGELWDTEGYVGRSTQSLYLDYSHDL